MYGTIAKLKVKPGMVDQLDRFMDDHEPEGMVGSYILQSDEKENELWLVALFEDKKSYVANAESPEQDKEYQVLRKMMTAEPEWHDGKVVFEINNGGG